MKLGGHVANRELPIAADERNRYVLARLTLAELHFHDEPKWFEWSSPTWLFALWLVERVAFTPRMLL